MNVGLRPRLPGWARADSPAGENSHQGDVMSFKPITLISPSGNEYVTDTAVEFNNLTNKGYTPKQNVKPETVLARAAESKSDTK